MKGNFSSVRPRCAEGVLLKEIKWRQNCNYMGYRFVAIAIENGGLLSDTTLGLLDELTNRLPANDRLRFAKTK